MELLDYLFILFVMVLAWMASQDDLGGGGRRRRIPIAF